MDEQPLPETTRRDGVESVPIKLADGNCWGLAVPRPRLRPRVVRSVDTLGRPTETIHVTSEFGYPLEIRRLIEGLRLACDQGTAERQHEALFCLAATLILRVHDLNLEEVSRLLELDLEELPRFVATVLSVVTGEDLDSRNSLVERDNHA